MPLPTGFDTPGKPVAKVTEASTLSLNTRTGSSAKTDKPVEIPKDMVMKPPQTVVEGNTKVPDHQKQAFRLTYVIDGDTVKGQAANGSNLNCRIEGINAPETAKKDKAGQPSGEAAKTYMMDLLKKGELTVRVTEPASKKNHDRPVCSIEVSGANVSLAMVEAGFAQVYDQFAKEPMLRRQLYGAQVAAKEKGAGMYDASKYTQPPEDPSMFLRRQAKSN